MLVRITVDHLVENCSLSELRQFQIDLEKAVTRQHTYVANYRRKHPPRDGETMVEYVKRLREADPNKPHLAFLRDAFYGDKFC